MRLPHCLPFLQHRPDAKGRPAARDVRDRAVWQPAVGAGSQRVTAVFCRMGRYNLCPDIKFFATPPVHGSLADFVDHPADFCFKLPDNVSHEDGAMAEPLSNGITACRRGQVACASCAAVLAEAVVGGGMQSLDGIFWLGKAGQPEKLLAEVSLEVRTQGQIGSWVAFACLRFDSTCKDCTQTPAWSTCAAFPSACTAVWLSWALSTCFEMGLLGFKAGNASEKQD